MLTGLTWKSEGQRQNPLLVLLSALCLFQVEAARREDMSSYKPLAPKERVITENKREKVNHSYPYSSGHYTHLLTL